MMTLTIKCPHLIFLWFTIFTFAEVLLTDFGFHLLQGLPQTYLNPLMLKECESQEFLPVPQKVEHLVWFSFSVSFHMEFPPFSRSFHWIESLLTIIFHSHQNSLPYFQLLSRFYSTKPKHPVRVHRNGCDRF